VPVPKVLVLTGDAAESLEVMYPYQRLREEGYEVHIAAPSKKKLHFVVHDFEPGSMTPTRKNRATAGTQMSPLPT
jgi:protease I